MAAIQGEELSLAGQVVDYERVQGVSSFQRQWLARVAARPDFARWVLTGLPGVSTEAGLSVEGRAQPRVWSWYDQSGRLHAARVGTVKLLQEVTASG